MSMVSEWMEYEYYVRTVDPSLDDVSRSIALSGCFNFRDVGGYPSRRDYNGRRIGWRRLFRADGLSELTRADMSLLLSLGLNTVIDLRTHREVERNGRVPEAGRRLRYEHLPLSETVPGAEALAAWTAPDHVASSYLEILDEGIPVVVRVLEILADTDGLPAVIHCSAGKDRTGIVIAVVLGMLGICDEIIVHDYELSREPLNRMLRALVEQGDMRDAIANLPATVLPTEPAAMSGFLALFRARYGSFEGFTQWLQAGALIDRVAENLLN